MRIATVEDRADLGHERAFGNAGADIGDFDAGDAANKVVFRFVSDDETRSRRCSSTSSVDNQLIVNKDVCSTGRRLDSDLVPLAVADKSCDALVSARVSRSLRV